MDVLPSSDEFSADRAKSSESLSMSTWQLRFGRQSQVKGQKHFGADNQENEHDNDLVTQLLSRRNEDDGILDNHGRACAEALIGRKNTFLSSYRMAENHARPITDIESTTERDGIWLSKPSLLKRLEDEQLICSAHEIAQSRVRVETEADAIRSAKDRSKCLSQSSRLRKNAEVTVRKKSFRSSTETIDRCREKSVPGLRKKTKASGRKSNRLINTVIASDKTKDIPLLDVKRIQLRIQQVEADNQREESKLEEFERKLQQKHLMKQVMQSWQSYRAYRGKIEKKAQVKCDYKVVTSAFVRWKRYTMACQASRAAELHVRTIQHLTIADAFYHQKFLPKYFHGWKANTRARKHLDQVQQVSEKRRQMRTKLIERLVKGRDEHPHSTGPPSGANVSSALPHLPPPGMDELSRQQHDALLQSPPPPVASRSGSITHLMRRTQRKQSSHRVQDSVVVTMQKRAAERKSRRELLKAKYAETSKRKQEALIAKQVQLESMVESRRQEEKERAREENRLKQTKELEKQQRRDRYRIILHRVLEFNRCRLLYHYGFHPLWRYQKRRKALEHKAYRWYLLSIQFRLFQAWLFFCKCCRAYREHIEDQKQAIASSHHNGAMCRRSLTHWKLLHAWFYHAETTLYSQTIKSIMEQGLKTWRYRNAQAQMAHCALVNTMRQRTDRRKKALVFQAWCRVIKQIIDDRQIAREKDFLWRKAQQWLEEL